MALETFDTTRHGKLLKISDGQYVLLDEIAAVSAKAVMNDVAGAVGLRTTELILLMKSGVEITRRVGNIEKAKEMVVEIINML